ncbi:MAG: WD40 repeat domain-containing protein, partial [Cytophagaceae bacterium]|nr:WD40 repeat domain-containing protein [Gemmatimonadaceae bacterium]
MEPDTRNMRFELSHDTIARQVFDKASAEAQARRKVEKYIGDRLAMYRERGTLLTRDDLNYVQPWLSAIRVDAAESALIADSRRAVNRQRNRLRMTVVGIIAILSISTIAAVIARGTARTQAELATARHVVSKAIAAMDQGVLDLAALYAVEAERYPMERSPLLTWHLSSARARGYLAGHTDAVSAVTFSPDGQLVASASWDSTVMVWNAGTRRAVGEPLHGHTGMVNGIAFSPDGGTLAAATEDGAIVLWDVAKGQQRGEPLRVHAAAVEVVAYSPDGTSFATGSDDSTVIVWDASTSRPRGPPLRGHGGVVTGVAFSADGRRLASSSKDSSVIVWDVATA